MITSLLLNPYTPPDDYGPSDDAMGLITALIVAVVIILFLLIIIIMLLPNKRKNSQHDDEKRLIKSYRASKNLSDDIPIDMETLSEEEKRLIEEYRKNS